MRDAAAVLRLRLPLRPPPEEEGRLEDALVPDWLLARVGDAVFFAEDFFAVDFFAGDFLAAADFAAVDPVVVDLAAVDLAAAFLAPVVRRAAAADLAGVAVPPPAAFVPLPLAPAVFAAVVLPEAAFASAGFPVAAFVAAVFAVAAFVAAALLVVFLADVRAGLVPAAPRAPAASASPPFAALPSPPRPFCPFCPRGCVSQATAAPVTATGHSTRPATPSTPAPV